MLRIARTQDRQPEDRHPDDGGPADRDTRRQGERGRADADAGRGERSGDDAVTEAARTGDAAEGPEDRSRGEGRGRRQRNGHAGDEGSVSSSGDNGPGSARRGPSGLTAQERADAQLAAAAASMSDDVIDIPADGESGLVDTPESKPRPRRPRKPRAQTAAAPAEPKGRPGEGGAVQDSAAD